MTLVCATVQQRTLDIGQVMFIRYKSHRAMYNWSPYSPCTRKTIQNTHFQQHTIFRNTEMLWGGFLYLFLYNFVYYMFFFQLKNSLFCVLNILPLITASTEMWYPKIRNRCWEWWLLNGHLLYGSTPNLSAINVL